MVARDAIMPVALIVHFLDPRVIMANQWRMSTYKIHRTVFERYGIPLDSWIAWKEDQQRRQNEHFARLEKHRELKNKRKEEEQKAKEQILAAAVQVAVSATVPVPANQPAEAVDRGGQVLTPIAEEVANKTERDTSWDQPETQGGEGWWSGQQSGWTNRSSSSWNSWGSHKWSSTQRGQWRETAPEWKRRRWEPREEGQHSSWSGDASASRSYPEQGSGSSSSSQPAPIVTASPPRRGEPGSNVWEIYGPRIVSGQLSDEQMRSLCLKTKSPSIHVMIETAAKWHEENIGPITMRTEGDQLVYDNRLHDAVAAAEAGAPPGPKATQKIMPL